MSDAQLWLTVFEDTGPEWPVKLDATQWRVAITRSDTLQGCDITGACRASPIFPADQASSLPDLNSGTYYLYFLCFNSAFRVLAKLLENASVELRSGLFFSLGIASIVIVTRETTVLDQMEALCGESPWASETWRIESSRIVFVAIKAPQPPQIDPRDILRIDAYEMLPLVQRATVDEFVAAFGLLTPKIAIHVPSETVTFRRVHKLAEELVTEMRYASNPKGPPPTTLDEYTEQDFKEQPALAETIVHQATDRLIQINDALSYLSTQALSGAVPILERRSLIRRSSLLGVGTGILALTRISRSIESAFASAALEDALSDRGKDAAPLPGLEKLPVYDPAEWKENSVDRWNGKIPSREPYPKLPYFSGSLGYRESEYAISAAVQALAAGAGPQWSLLTLTHELVHGHVRALLSTILQGDPTRRPWAKWAEYYQKFKDTVRGNPVPNSSLLDSLRTILLSYCCMTMTYGSLTRSKTFEVKGAGFREIRRDVYLPTSEDLKRLVESEYRNINEVFVHVLDLHYFYRSSVSAYVPLIWRSWSIMPQVRGDLRQYLLRTLLAAAVKTTGSPHERFRQCLLRVSELLAPLQSGPGDGVATIREAVAALEAQAIFEDLFLPFSASLILVDVVHHVLTSAAIRGKLHAGDPHLHMSENHASFEQWIEYTLPDGFVDDVVAAPTAYIAHRLANKLLSDDSQMLERETVQMFLACCSRTADGGGYA